MRIVRRYINTQIFKAVLFVATGFLALFAFFDVLNDLSFYQPHGQPLRNRQLAGLHHHAVARSYL